MIMRPPVPALPHQPSAAPAPRATGWRAWLPNAITISRLVLALLFFVILAGDPLRGSFLGFSWHICTVAGAVFIVAALTDVLDGFLARRWGVTSRFGRIMDPFADKILVIGASVILAGPGFSTIGADGRPDQISGVAPWMVVLILARELLVTSIRAVLEREGRDFPATLSGKLKMFVQSAAIPTILLTIGLLDTSPGSGGRLTIHIAVWTTIIVTLISGWPYVRRGMLAIQT